MNTIGIMYITFGIAYLIACVMDGQDVKPLWKKWVGKRLERAANYFYPIKYVNMPSITPSECCVYEQVTFDAVKIRSQAMISESDIMMSFRRIPYERETVIPRLINDAKRACLRSIYDKVASAVSFDVDRETRRPNIIVRASLYVGRNSQRTGIKYANSNQMFRKERTMTKFNQDYKITISGDLNGNAYWGLLRKGEPAACNEDEIRMVAQVFGELKEKIDKQY